MSMVGLSPQAGITPTTPIAFKPDAFQSISAPRTSWVMTVVIHQFHRSLIGEKLVLKCFKHKTS
jgi:hypothetical protein